MIKYFDKETLEQMVFNKNYCFPNNRFEPSNSEPIDKDTSISELKNYIYEYYQAGCDEVDHKNKIKNIIGVDGKLILDDNLEQYITVSNRSEYFKVLTHCAILSKVRQGWNNILSIDLNKYSRSSLTNTSLMPGIDQHQAEYAAINRCFFDRLLEGMSEEDKKRYEILFQFSFFPSGFANLIDCLDSDFQNLYSFFEQQDDSFWDESVLPDANSGEVLLKTFEYFLRALELTNYAEESYRTDTLRATLIKCASINCAVNQIDAIINIQNGIIDNLPEKLECLHQIDDESQILPSVARIFNVPLKQLPDNLKECAILVCNMYAQTNVPPINQEQFYELHRSPVFIAASAALIYQNKLLKTTIKIEIKGSNNKNKQVYRLLSNFEKRQRPLGDFKLESLIQYNFEQELFKYLTTRYSVTASGLARAYPLKIAAKAQLKVKEQKLQTQKEMNLLLRVLSVKKACLVISVFHECVKQLINGSSH